MLHTPRPGLAGTALLGLLMSSVSFEDGSEDDSPDLRCAPVQLPPSLEAVAVALTLMRASSCAGSVSSSHLWLEDPSTATLRLVASAGPEAPRAEPVPMDDDPLGLALSSGAARLRRVTTHAGKARWRFVLPLSTGDARGVAAVDFATTGPPETACLVEVSSRLSGALAGSLALHVARTETSTARALLEVMRDLSRRLDPADVVNLMLEKAMDMSSATSGSVMLRDDATNMLRIAASRGLSRDITETTRVAEGEGIAGWVLTTGRPLLVEDLPGRDRPGKRPGVRSAVSVPIADEDGVLGVLNVGSGTFPARFTDTHVQALEALAGQGAVALRNARAVTSARELYFSTLKALSLAMETKDPYAHGSTERVTRQALALGRALGLDEQESQALEVASLLHDIGMEAAGDIAATSGRPLSTIERGLIKMHPVLAVEILREVPALGDVVPIVYHHHEWYDGRGYVAGLAGEHIPLGARVLSVADAFVAMTSDRPYRVAMTLDEAVAELLDKAGTQFDPVVVDTFVDLLAGDPSLAEPVETPSERRARLS